MKKWEIEIKRLDKIRLELGLNSGKIQARIGINRKQLDRYFSLETEPGLENYLTIKEFLENEYKVVFADVIGEEVVDGNKELKSVVKKENDCGCKLLNGLFFRDKANCNKPKEEHKF